MTNKLPFKIIEPAPEANAVAREIRKAAMPNNSNESTNVPFGFRIVGCIWLLFCLVCVWKAGKICLTGDFTVLLSPPLWAVVFIAIPVYSFVIFHKRDS
jgi:hypothetical protein